MPGSLCQPGATAPVMLLVNSRVTMVDTYPALLEYSAPAGDIATACQPCCCCGCLCGLKKLFYSPNSLCCGGFLLNCTGFFGTFCRFTLLRSHIVAVSQCWHQDISSCLGLSMTMVFCWLILAELHHPKLQQVHWRYRLTKQSYDDPHLSVQVLLAGLLQGGCKMQVCSP